MPNATERPDYNQAVRKLARKCALFVEHYWPRLERRGGVPEIPFDRKSKGSSNPPFSETTMEIVEANKGASARFRFFLEFFEGSETKSEDGVYFSEVLKTLRADPGALTNWRAGETEKQREMMRSFDEVCEAVAKGVLFVHPNTNPDEVVVYTNPNDLPAKDLHDAHMKKRTYTAQDSYRKIVEGVEALEAEGYSREAAKATKAEQLDCSYWRIQDAIRFVNRERRGEVA